MPISRHGIEQVFLMGGDGKQHEFRGGNHRRPGPTALGQQDGKPRHPDDLAVPGHEIPHEAEDHLLMDVLANAVDVQQIQIKKAQGTAAPQQQAHDGGQDHGDAPEACRAEG